MNLLFAFYFNLLILNSPASDNVAVQIRQEINAASQALDNIEQIQNANKKIEVLSRLADAYEQAGNYAKALNFYQRVYQNHQELSPNMKANLLLKLCNTSWRVSDLEPALDYGLQALRIYENNKNRKGVAETLHNIGIVYDYLGANKKSLEYHKRALALRKQFKDKKGIADSLNNLGIIKHKMGEFNSVLNYYLESLKIRQEIKDQAGVASSYNNIGVLYNALKEYQKALDYYGRSLKQHQALGNKYEAANNLNNIGEVYIYLGNYDQVLTSLEQALNLAREINAKDIVRENYLFLSKFHESQDDYKNALAYYQLSVELYKLITNADIKQKTADLQAKYQTEKKEKEIALLRKDNDIKQLQLTKQTLIQRSFIGGFILSLMVLFFIFNRYQIKKKAHEQISLEKDKSDKLLQNILPNKVAADLKEKGYTNPESFEHVSVFFSDIVGFTKISSDLDPKVLINELNTLFTAFDNIIEKNQCERIKTIGDAYFAVCGIPDENDNHAHNMVHSALEIMAYLDQHNKNPDNIAWQIRVGIHSGQVVGGVVGIKKYIYDVFGDTINTASRMESNSQPMRINISESTYQHVKANFDCEYRGSLDVKGKGKLNMYFVNHLLESHS